MDSFQSNGNVDESLKLEALKLCQEFIGGQWSKASLKDFAFTTLSGGFSNQLYLCRLSDKAESVDQRTPNQVLFRIYGILQEDYSIVVAEAATFMLLAERNLGPKLYGVFPKGRLEEYIPSRILNSDDIRQYSTTIAKEMAKIHSLQVPIRKVPDMITKYFNKWIKQIKDSTSPKRDLLVSLTKTYPEEMEWLCQQIMERTESPIVFCHNDLQGGNILLRQDTAENEKPELMLIDFEFGSYNYRGFDIGNQFCEWCFDYNTKEFPHFQANFEKYPCREEQIEYIEVYLNQLKEMGCLDKCTSIAKETQKILKEVMILRLASHLLWSTWSYQTSFIALAEFSHIEYGKARFQGYLKHKKELLDAPFYKDFPLSENGHEM